MADCLYLEDLAPGNQWKSPGRTVTESDIVAFAGLTGDFDPLHVDHQYAAETPYGKPIAHGLLGLSFMAGLSSNHPRVRTLALIQICDWQFARPIYKGDTIRVVTEVESIKPRGRRSGEVTWIRRIINQKDECVQFGKIVTLVSSHSFLPRISSGSAVPAMKMGKFAPEGLPAADATSEPS